jgi:hypothetical protein
VRRQSNFLAAVICSRTVYVRSYCSWVLIIFCSGTINHPFVWFEDEFTTLDPSIWAVDEYGFYTANAGRLSASPFFQIYLRPNTSTSAWNLPIGADINSVSVSLLGGTIYDPHLCCVEAWAFGIQDIYYERQGTGPTGGAPKTGSQCQQANLTCITSTSNCPSATGSWTEKFYVSGGPTLVQATQSLCGGDFCQCSLRGYQLPAGRFPRQNLTTVR